MIDNEDTTEDMVSCQACHNEDTEDNMYLTHYEAWVCSDCMLSCEHCDNIGMDNDDWYHVSGERWCEACHEQDSHYCDRCEEYINIRRYSYARVGDDTWCEGCLEYSASFCEDCDEYYDSEESCYTCDGGFTNELVQDYRYKPDPEFHGIDKQGLYMGFELEMELNNINGSEYAQAVESTRVLSDTRTAYLKHDGSINGRGFELVTHPHTLYAYEHAKDLWDTIEQLRDKYKARSWDTNSCGLHVHVSRNAFKSGAHIHRFIRMIYQNPAEMSKLGGRKGSRYATFADVYQHDEYGIPRFTVKHKVQRNGWSTERYSAVNTNNEHTLELRFFRGNMKREGIMSALELTHAAVEYTRDLSVSDVKLGMLSWEWFADWVAINNGLYPNLYVRMARVPSTNLDNRPLLNA